MNDMKPNAIIATAIRREREIAQLSLSALAAKANLAKSTLSHLEAGKGNPNVDTLWAIATALGIPLSSLFEKASSQAQLIRVEDGVTIASDHSDFTAVLLKKCPPDRRRDLYRILMQPGSVQQSDPHSRGTIEHAIVCRGRVLLGPLNTLTELGPGDYFRYFGDVPHSYEALSEDVLLLLVMDSAS